jgi:hypothetical protein
MMMEGWGEKTQRRIKCSTVFVAGGERVGLPFFICLAVIGVGIIRICDFDFSSFSSRWIG